MRNAGLVTAALILLTAGARAQSKTIVAQLPSAPIPALDLAPQTGGSSAAPAGSQPQTLTRVQAEQMALKNNPRVSVTALLALAQHQVVRQAHSADLPTVTAALTAEDSENASRMSAGELQASRLFPHAGGGVFGSQLITDFGRTHNLVLTQKLEEQATKSTALATKEEIVLAVDQAFYDALTAQAVLQVAIQTVATRQTTETQVDQMTQNKLRSTLDLSFADVDLSQAKLLQLNAQDNSDASMAILDSVLGLDHEVDYKLIEDADQPAAPASDFNSLVQIALQQRPDLQSLTYGAQSEQKYARAQWEQLLPNISALGTAGTVPIRVDHYYTSNWWGGIGVNMEIPVFNGFLYTAQARQAEYQARADSEMERTLRDQIVRDVRTAWLQEKTSYQRLSVTAELLNEANLALRLSQARYRLGLSSIVELSQAQLQQTSAAIQDTNAQYEYRLAIATVNYEIGVAP